MPTIRIQQQYDIVTCRWPLIFNADLLNNLLWNCSGVSIRCKYVLQFVVQHAVRQIEASGVGTLA